MLYMEGMMLKLKLQYFGHLMGRVDSLEKDSDARRDWGQEEKGTTEDEMAGWHHWLDGHESQWTPGVGDGQGGLACCNSWGRKESDTTERLIWSDSSAILNEHSAPHPKLGKGQRKNRNQQFPLSQSWWWVLSTEKTGNKPTGSLAPLTCCLTFTRIGLGPLPKMPTETLGPLHQVSTQWEDASYEPGRGPSPELNYTGALILDFQPPGLWKINFCSL